MLVQTLSFNVSGDNLTIRIRKRMFRVMLRQEVGWFDDERHSTGALTHMLTEDGINIQGVGFYQ